jgi:cellulose synthase/poly-beta-1,6-N-acetylglucosamine synthase-like glycosyltransferase
MITTIIIVLLIVATVYYVLFLGNVVRGLRTLQTSIDREGKTRFVSVVLAARNEENAIRSCLEALFAQDYPTHLYEVIVVDDGSSDGTAAVVASIAVHKNSLRLVSARDGAHFIREGKPAALSRGISESKGEVILTTDADCIVPGTWISTMVGSLGPGVAFAAGPVREIPGSSVLSRLAHLEMLGLVTTGAGLIGSGHPIICNGANLAYTKEAFFKAQGFGTDQPWCDDETLMQRIHQRKLGQIIFVSSEEAVVTTGAQQTLRSFWIQRLRWSAKGGHYESTSILLAVVGLYLFFLLSFLSLIGGIWNEQLLVCFLASFFAKLLVDYWTLSAGARTLRDHFSAGVFLFAEVLHAPYIVFTAGLGQFISFQWKGRTLNQ